MELGGAADEDGWTRVGPTRRRRQFPGQHGKNARGCVMEERVRRARELAACAPQERAIGEEAGSNRDAASAVLECVRAELSALTSSAWWLSAKKIVIRALFEQRNEHVEHYRVACMGLGSFQKSRNARVQLALAVALRCTCEQYANPTKSAVELSRVAEFGSFVDTEPGDHMLYDPVMNEVDELVAKSVGFRAAQDRTEALAACSVHMNRDERLLLFMPHCGKLLYSAVLEANWSPDRLVRAVIFGNAFSFYSMPRLSTSSDVGENHVTFVERVAEFVHERRCAAPSRSTSLGREHDPSHFYMALNDLALHWFDQNSLSALPKDHWLESARQLSCDRVQADGQELP